MPTSVPLSTMPAPAATANTAATAAVNQAKLWATLSRSPERRSLAGRHRCEFRCSLLQMRRRRCDHGHFRAFLLVRFVVGIRRRTAGGRVEPHQEESGHGGGHAHDRQPEDRVAAGGHNRAGGGTDHEDQLGGDRVQGECGPPLIAVGQDAKGLAHHAEDGQGQQSPDEHQWQQPFVGHVRHDGPDDGFGDDRGNQRPPKAHGVNPAPAPRRADGDADGHDGGRRAGGGISLAQGEDDVQGQQHARCGVRYAGYHSHDQQPPDRPDRQQLIVESEIHGLRPSSCRRQVRDVSPLPPATLLRAATLPRSSQRARQTPHSGTSRSSVPPRWTGHRQRRVRLPGRAPP